MSNEENIDIIPGKSETRLISVLTFYKINTFVLLIRHRIQATDDLIDQIVYKLYGLTEEEINIVKGASK